LKPAVPELPEVEVVRRGLERGVVGRRIASVHVRHPRSVRRHPAGAADFAGALVGATPAAACRRGKYLWLPLRRAAHGGADADGGGADGAPPSAAGALPALLGHLGMSGQLLVVPPGSPDQTHLRVRFTFADGGGELRFVDQRTFGGLAVVPAPGQVPEPLAHIARDPLDREFDGVAFAAALRRRRTGLKRALLDQTLVSGIGNIYADEALWRARLHYARPTDTLTRAETVRVLDAVREVMLAALEAGGTSFDALYVSVNGVSGLFDRSLQAYGRTGLPCARCGTPIRRDAFMNRSSFTCPTCQPRPRRARW
jgi:formamidopyrimidine-DNA glycosylase